MSYILDALQRADAERSRGSVPGLQSQPSYHTSASSSPTPPNSRNAIWMGAGLVLAIAAGWWLWSARGSAGKVETRAAANVPVSAPATPSSSPTRASAPQPPSLPEPAAPPPAMGAASAAPIAAEATPRAASPTPKSPALQAAVASSSPGGAQPPWLAELPEDLRRQMASIQITGSVYSDNPAQRLLLVNGQVLSQGSTVVPEVVLEEIRERHSVLSFRGTRFRLAH